MTAEEKDALEEVFVTRHFKIETMEEKEIHYNLEIAEELWQQSKRKVDEFAERIEDGEMIDSSECILAIQTMILSKSYKAKFEKQLIR